MCVGIYFFFPFGVGDGGVTGRALWRFHFHICVISRNFPPLEEINLGPERRTRERGQPGVLLSLLSFFTKFLVLF